MIYAIDYGTSNSLLAGANDGQILEPLALDGTGHGDSVMRSLMFFPREGGIYFGQSAIDQYVEMGGDGRFLRSIKRFLPSRSFVSTRIQNKTYRLETIISRFLREMKTRAETQLEKPVESVVMGRPAKFSTDDEEESLAQKRLESAANEAGFKHVSFFPEPLAAAYDYRKEVHDEKIVLIVDLGGGTSDFTVIRLDSNRFKDDDVLSMGGISVAGDALDGAIMRNLVAPFFGSEVKFKFPLGSNILSMPRELQFKLSSPADITLLSRNDLLNYLRTVEKAVLTEADKVAMGRLFTLIEDNLGFPVFEAIEGAKRRVCSNEGKTEFRYEYPSIEISAPLQRSDFESYSERDIERIMSTMDEVVRMSGVSADKIDLICCTGGTSQVPAVAEGLVKRFGREKIQTRKFFHSVIRGLSERALDLL